MVKPRWRRVGLACLLLSILDGCSCGPQPALVTQEQLDAEKQQNIEVGTKEVNINLRGPDGEPLWKVQGTLRSSYVDKQAQVAVLDAEAQSAIPGYDVHAVAGRVRYEINDPTVEFDRRLFVGSPSRRADLETEAASFVIESKRFVVEGLARLRYEQVVLLSENLSAVMDLREATATGLTAVADSEQGSWTAKAVKGEGDWTGRVTLTQVTGTMTDDGVTTRFKAPIAVWKPAQEWLNFNQGGTLTREGLTVVADSLTWQRREGKVIARGTTRFERPELTATGTGGEIDLTARTAKLANLRAQVKGALLTAAEGRVASDQTISVSDLRATLRESNTRVTAPAATYHPTRRELVLPRGGTATQQGASFRADRVVWSAAQERFTATGNVRLTQNGNQVTGDRLSGPSDLSRATLTPIRASGAAPRRWTLSAASGDWARGGQVRLRQADGTFRAEGRQVQATASTVTYQPDEEKVYFSGGFHAVSPADAIDVRADRAEYDLASGVFRAFGSVLAKIRGVAVKNRQWTYYFGREAGKVAESGRPPRRERVSPPPSRVAPPETGGPDGRVTGERGEVSVMSGGEEGTDKGATGTDDRPGDRGGEGPEVSGPTPDPAGPAG